MGRSRQEYQLRTSFPMKTLVVERRVIRLPRHIRRSLPSQCGAGRRLLSWLHQDSALVTAVS